jgi:hypothetical protein
MKNRNILRISGILMVLALLIALVPASAVSAAASNSITLNKTTAKVGESVTVTGQITPSSAEIDVIIYISNLVIPTGSNIQSYPTYKALGGATLLTATEGPDGDFTTSIVIPAVIDEGDTDVTVTGGTYYIYATRVYSTSETIRCSTTINITVPALDALSPSSGPAGTDVSITGSGFTASTALVFKLDGTTIMTPKTGTDTAVRSTGIFISTVTIPTATAAGAHSIKVYLGTSTTVAATATFTVTASAALNPLVPTTGNAGSDVTISGTAFLASYPIIFKFDTTTLTPKSGDANTNTSGGFSSVITIPATATAGVHNITVTVGTATVTATYTVNASPTLNALAPASGKAGSDTTVGGNAFMISYPIIFKFDATTLTPKSGDVNTSTAGSFSTVITIPANATAGDHAVSVTVGSVTVTATYTVTGSGGTTTTPTTTTPASDGSKILFTGGAHAAGSTISLVGMGFTPGLDITFTFDSVLMTKVTASGDGVGAISYTIPAGKSGAHIIAASDGIKTATLDFPIEAVAPPVPQPKAPGMNANVKSPVTFSWMAVTDDSIPVTYDLQISSDANFTAGTIIIDKTKLAAVDYTLTSEELLKLSNGKISYYWREKSVDAALNESAWSPAVPFSVTQPFTFSGTPMYLTFAAIGIVLFLLGLWIGRRTAFSY